MYCIEYMPLWLYYRMLSVINDFADPHIQAVLGMHDEIQHIVAFAIEYGQYATFW